VRILIAEDDPISRMVLEANLRNWGHEVVVTTNGLEAYRAMQEESAPRLAILDWMMPGLSGVDICRRIRQAAASAPIYIILLTSMNRSDNIVEGLEAGADDYLSKPFDSAELKVRLQAGARIIELQSNLAERVRQLEAAIVERQAVEEKLRNLTLTDDLTGLYNARGFYTLARHLGKIARRSAEDSLLIYADMDGLKQINDRYGHSHGSAAISKMAEILRQTFRQSDIIGRLGGDEFAVLAPNVPVARFAEITTRLLTNIQTYNEQNEHPYSLGLSVGAVGIPFDAEATIEEFIAEADAAMYEDKRRRKNAGLVDGNLQEKLGQRSSSEKAGPQPPVAARNEVSTESGMH
jgi:two-component system cell cycle response regulator